MDSIQLDDGNYISGRACEITEIPYSAIMGDDDEKVHESIRHIFHEILDLTDESSSVEVTFEKNDDSLRIFLVFRRMMETADSPLAYDRMVSLLQKAGYTVQDDATDSFEEYFTELSHKHITAITKKEISDRSMQTGMIYYSYDVAEADENFAQHILTLVGNSSDLSISFQIMPIEVTQNDTVALEQLYQFSLQASAGYFQPRMGLVRDIISDSAQKTFEFYHNTYNGKCFGINILVSSESAEASKSAAVTVASDIHAENTGSDARMTRTDVSELFVGSTGEWLYLPWNIWQTLMYTGRGDLFWEGFQKIARRLPFIWAESETEAFALLPVGDDHTTTVRVNRINRISGAVQEVGDASDIAIGRIYDGSREYFVPLNDFSKHLLVLGTPGSGKTTFALNLLLQFYHRDIPFLAVEPAKTEYRALLREIPQLQIYTPGNDSVSPFVFNPFMPPKGVPVGRYKGYLLSAFKSAFNMESPLDVIFQRAISETYLKYQWKDYSTCDSGDVIPFGMYEFILVFKNIIDRSTYKSDIKGNLQSAGLFRLLSIIERDRSVFDTVRTVPIEEILGRPTVIELNSIGDAEEKSLLMSLIFISICCYTYSNVKGDGKLKNIIMIDEAHVLFGDHSRDDRSGSVLTDMLYGMLAEIRSHGTGMIIADQMAEKVGKEAIANTGLKMYFRLTERNERNMAGDSIGMDDEEKQSFLSLPVGAGYFFSEKTSEPVFLTTEDVRKKYGILVTISDEEVSHRIEKSGSVRSYLKPYNDCRFCTCTECDRRIQADSIYSANRIYLKNAGEITRDNVQAFLQKAPEFMYEKSDNMTDEEKNNRILCTTIALIRKISLEKGYNFSDKYIEHLRRIEENG